MTQLMRVLALFFAFSLLAAACGDDDTSTDDAPADDAGTDDVDAPDDDPADAPDDDPADTGDQTADGDADEPGAAPPGEGDAPQSPVAAPLQQSYGSDPDAAMGFDVFAATAYWFEGADGFMAVQFHPVPASAFASTCPGASVSIGGGFEHIGNASTGGDACTGHTTVVGGDVKAYDCAGTLTLRTAIPNDAEADFFYGSLEHSADGAIKGYTSVATPGEEPELDVSTCTALA